MSVQLPTAADAKVLQAHVQVSVAAQGASPAEALDAASPITSVTDGLLANLASAMKFLCWPSIAIADPCSYFFTMAKEVTALQQSLLWNANILTQEEKHFGLLFAGPVVKLAYQKFFAAGEMLTAWCKATMELVASFVSSSTTPSASAATLVQATLVQDVTLPYATLLQGCLLLFSEDYTCFDAQQQRRMLVGKYLPLLAQCLAQVTNEVSRLETVLPILMRSNGGQVVVFKPALEQFVWLRETITVYGSCSLLADELSARTYFRVMLENLANEVKSLAAAIAGLPKPPPRVAPPAVDSSSGNEAVPEEGSPLAWAPPPERAPDMLATFERIDDIFARAVDLRKGLIVNITANNKSHRQVAMPAGYGTAVHPPQQQAPQQPVDVAATLQKKGMFSWASGLVKNAVSVVTCSAEPSTASSSGGGGDVRLTDKSPFALDKEQTLVEVSNLVASVGKVRDYLGATYPGMYSAGWGAKASKAAAQVMKGVTAVTTVFS